MNIAPSPHFFGHLMFQKNWDYEIHCQNNANPIYTLYYTCTVRDKHSKRSPCCCSMRITLHEVIHIIQLATMQIKHCMDGLLQTKKIWYENINVVCWETFGFAFQKF